MKKVSVARGVSLRAQLFSLMALLVLLQGLALVLALAVSRVYFRLDAEAFRLFGNATAARTQAYNQNVGALVAASVAASGELGERMPAVAAEHGVAVEALGGSQAAYEAAAADGTHTLLHLLENNATSGAFFVLDGAVVQRRQAVYIRNSSAGGAAASYIQEVGPIAVSRQYQIPTSVNWDLSIDVSEGDGFFHKPVEAAAAEPGAEIERYGYWSPPADILGDGQQVVCYTLPLLDDNGAVFGVMGIELSLPLITQHYLPNNDLPYHNSFYAIARLGGGELDMSWCIPSGPLAQAYLGAGAPLPLRPVAGTELYAAGLEGLGQMYCSVQPLVMYSKNSPFYGESWSLCGFVPQAALHQTSAEVRGILTFSLLLTTGLALAMVFLMVHIITRKIRGLSQYIKGLSPQTDIRFAHTGIREIDELTGAVETLSRSVRNAAKTTSKILELTLLPIGGYEVMADSGTVVLTEYMYKLLGLKPGAPVGKAEWAGMYKRLKAMPAYGYEDIYRYGTGTGRWLRILEAETDTGTVGVILDVTRDIEEHRRLAHELDYDALTRLYNRTAFKREAYLRLQRQPEKHGAMLFADLDNLKYINDTYGHDAGDRLIVRAAEMFRAFERYGGLVSRISGDEFAVFLHGYDSRDTLLDVIRGQLEENRGFTLSIPDGSSQRIRSSAGVAFYPEDSDNVTDLLKLSDFAMYEAKHNSKGEMFEFDAELYRQSAYLLENREAINRLLDDGLVGFAYQPIADLITGEVYAYEALMRPALENFHSPQEVLRVAAAQGKLAQLERMIILKLFGIAAGMLDELGGAKLFINSITSQRLTDDDHQYLQSHYTGVFPHIVLEVTEEENDNPALMRAKVDFMRGCGAQVAIDDFGSGYSNEVRILSMEPDVIKIDVELISGIDTDRDKQKLVGNLVSFCRPKGIKLIAEGVERGAELAEVMRLGVDCVQGYYTGRPDPVLRDIPPEVKEEIRAMQGQLE